MIISNSKLTVVSTGDAATLAAVLSSAGILLEAGVGNTAGALGNGTVVVLASDDLEASGSGGSGSSHGGKAEDDGGERELHLDGRKGICGLELFEKGC